MIEEDVNKYSIWNKAFSNDNIKLYNNKKCFESYKIRIQDKLKRLLTNFINFVLDNVNKNFNNQSTENIAIEEINKMEIKASQKYNIKIEDETRKLIKNKFQNENLLKKELYPIILKQAFRVKTFYFREDSFKILEKVIKTMKFSLVPETCLDILCNEYFNLSSMKSF